VGIVVSNDEIRRRLVEKRQGKPRKNLNEDGTVSSEELRQKFKEKRNQESPNPSYLVCDTCGGYYELQPGESPDDFADECECGGKLKHFNTLKS
jgi:hypothetical protein